MKKINKKYCQPQLCILKKLLFSFAKETHGQGAVEFAIVVSALVLISSAIYLIASKLIDGMLLEHAISSASHNLSGGMLGICADIFCV